MKCVNVCDLYPKNYGELRAKKHTNKTNKCDCSYRQICQSVQHVSKIEGVVVFVPWWSALEWHILKKPCRLYSVHDCTCEYIVQSYRTVMILTGRGGSGPTGAAEHVLLHLFPTNFGQSACNSVKVQPISTLRLPNHARPAAEPAEPPKLPALFPKCMHCRLNWPEKGVVMLQLFISISANAWQTGEIQDRMSRVTIFTHSTQSEPFHTAIM